MNRGQPAPRSAPSGNHVAGGAGLDSLAIQTASSLTVSSPPARGQRVKQLGPPSGSPAQSLRAERVSVRTAAQTRHKRLFTLIEFYIRPTQADLHLEPRPRAVARGGTRLL
jgi:hypothetical protein